MVALEGEAWCTEYFAGGFQLDFIAEGDVGALDVNGFFLAIYFDGHGGATISKEAELFICDFNITWL